MGQKIGHARDKVDHEASSSLSSWPPSWKTAVQGAASFDAPFRTPKIPRFRLDTPVYRMQTHRRSSLRQESIAFSCANLMTRQLCHQPIHRGPSSCPRPLRARRMRNMYWSCLVGKASWQFVRRLSSNLCSSSSLARQPWRRPPRAKFANFCSRLHHPAVFDR